MGASFSAAWCALQPTQAHLDDPTPEDPNAPVRPVTRSMTAARRLGQIGPCAPDE